MDVPSYGVAAVSQPDCLLADGLQGLGCVVVMMVVIGVVAGAAAAGAICGCCTAILRGRWTWWYVALLRLVIAVGGGVLGLWLHSCHELLSCCLLTART